MTSYLEAAAGVLEGAADGDVRALLDVTLDIISGHGSVAAVGTDHRTLGALADVCLWTRMDGRRQDNTHIQRHVLCQSVAREQRGQKGQPPLRLWQNLTSALATLALHGKKLIENRSCPFNLADVPEPLVFSSSLTLVITHRHITLPDLPIKLMSFTVSLPPHSAVSPGEYRQRTPCYSTGRAPVVGYTRWRGAAPSFAAPPCCRTCSRSRWAPASSRRRGSENGGEKTSASVATGPDDVTYSVTHCQSIRVATARGTTKDGQNLQSLYCINKRRTDKLIIIVGIDMTGPEAYDTVY